MGNSAVVSFTSVPASPSQSTTVASQASAPADGGTTATITVTLRDINGNPVVGRVISLAQTGHANVEPSPPAAFADDHGVAVFTVKDAIVESVSFTPRDASDNVVLPSVTIDFVAPQDNVDLAVSPATVPADGVTPITATVAVTNTLGQPVAGKTVSVLPQGSHAVISPASAQTDARGIASFQVTDAMLENNVTLIAQES